MDSRFREENQTGQDAGREPVSILVVEDSPTQAAQLSYLLEQRGYGVEVAANGRAALEVLARRRPTLVITDIVMPEMDGYALCREIKADARLRDLPVVIVTALSGIQDIAKSLECGADNFIRKPYDPRMLLARLDYILLNQELRKDRTVPPGTEVLLEGRRHQITSDRVQIVDLLISTYEEAVHMNEELQARQRDIVRSNQLLTGLYGIAEGLNRATAEGDVCAAALEGLVGLPSFRAGWIWLGDAGSGWRTAGRFGPAHLIPAEPAAGECACHGLAASERPPRGSTLLECARLPAREGGPPPRHACTPLWSRDRCLGLMNVVLADSGLSDDDRRILDAVASQLAVALERARLYGHLEALVEQRTAALQAENAERRRAEERVAGLNRIYAVLSGINSTIVRVREREELCREACRIAVDLGRFHLAWIGLLPDGEGPVELLAYRGLGEVARADEADCVARILKEGEALFARVMGSGTPFPADHLEGAAAATARSLGCRSSVLLPLVVEGRAAGLLALYADRPGTFDPGEMRLLEELAGDISFALEVIGKEEQLNYLAYYDALTGLANRSLFHDRVNQLLQDSHHAGPVTVLAIGLERFRDINDSFGRHVGDSVLKLVAQRLGQALGSADRLSRLGADHFAALLTHVDGAEDVAHFLRERVAAAMGEPFEVGGRELRVAIKVGVALAPADGREADTLVTNAETALRNASAAGERFLFYAPNMNARVVQKLTLEHKLRRAVDNGEFVLHYQPKCDLARGRITGMEALIRWNDPEAGLVLPQEFVPMLEETGLILEVGRWVLKQAIDDAWAWRSRKLEPPRIAVNVSAVQLRQKDFLRTVTAALGHRSGVEHLELELTESLIMEDIEANIGLLKAVRELGVRIAVDDFGTGYSSLSYIAKLPIDALKIDQSFIERMTKSPDDATIVISIISLAHALNFKVVAEGVETEEQQKILRLLRCDEIQGYVYSRPLAPEGIAALLAGRLPG